METLSPAGHPKAWTVSLSMFRSRTPEHLSVSQPTIDDAHR